MNIMIYVSNQIGIILINTTTALKLRTFFLGIIINIMLNDIPTYNNPSATPTNDMLYVINIFMASAKTRTEIKVYRNMFNNESNSFELLGANFPLLLPNLTHIRYDSISTMTRYVGILVGSNVKRSLIL